MTTQTAIPMSRGNGHLSQRSVLQSREKVCIFIDNSNLFHALRGLAGEWGEQRKLDYILLKEALAEGRDCDVRFYYSVPEGDGDSSDKSAQRRSNFYAFLGENLKFHMISLPLRERSGYNPVVVSLVNTLRKRGVTDDELLRITGQRSHWLRQIRGDNTISEEKGLDCEVVYDMVKLSYHRQFHTYVLVAGDEDYARTIRKLRNETGIRIEVAFFGPGRCSKVLRREASAFIDLMKIPELFK